MFVFFKEEINLQEETRPKSLIRKLMTCTSGWHSGMSVCRAKEIGRPPKK